MSDRSSDTYQTKNEMREKEDKLIEVLEKRVRKRKTIEACTNRIKILRNFIEQISPSSSGDDEDAEDSEEENKRREEIMNTTIKRYYDTESRNKSGVYRFDITNEINQPLCQVTSTFNIYEYQTLDTPQDRQHYRVIFDIVNGEVTKYARTITAQQADELLRKAHKKPGEISRAENIWPNKETINNNINKPSVAKNLEKSVTTNITDDMAKKMPMMQDNLKIQIPLEKVQVQINDISEEKQYDDISPWEMDTPEDSDDSFRPGRRKKKQKKSKYKAKQEKRKGGRPRKCPKLEETRANKATTTDDIQKYYNAPRIISNILLTGPTDTVSCALNLAEAKSSQARSLRWTPVSQTANHALVVDPCQPVMELEKFQADNRQHQGKEIVLRPADQLMTFQQKAENVEENNKCDKKDTQREKDNIFLFYFDLLQRF